MKIIKVKKSELIEALTEALSYGGDTDWDLYLREDGELQMRHNTHDNRNWFELVDCCNLVFCDENGNYPGDDDYDYAGVASWVVNELDTVPTELEDVYDEETGDFITIDIELIDEQQPHL